MRWPRKSMDEALLHETPGILMKERVKNRGQRQVLQLPYGSTFWGLWILLKCCTFALNWVSPIIAGMCNRAVFILELSEKRAYG